MTDRYESVRATLPAILPPLTRAEAQKAADRIWRKFVPKQQRFETSRKVRRCWISTKPTSGHWKGWGRLVHDLSHNVFRRVYRNTRRPHDPLHAKYEADIAEFVVKAGWLDGSLKPKVPAKPSLTEKRAADLKRTEEAIARWESKARRAAKALKKLKIKQRRLQRVLH